MRQANPALTEALSSHSLPTVIIAALFKASSHNRRFTAEFESFLKAALAKQAAETH